MAGCQVLDADACRQSVDIVDDALEPADFRRLDQAPETNEARAARAHGYLAQSCDDVRASRIRGSRFSNYVCTLPGSIDDRIVIGAHYDKTAKGAGIADNWTGVVIVSRLVSYFAQHRPHHTLAFVMFGEEEPGMRGSNSYVRDESVDDIIAMINVDTLGVDIATIDKRSDDRLECLAHSVASRAGVAVRSLNVRQTTGDWEPFKQRQVPILNLHALDRKSARSLVHTRRDRREAVDDTHLNDAWRLTLNLIVNLDDPRRDIMQGSTIRP